MERNFSIETLILLSLLLLFTFIFGGVLGGLGVYMRMKGLNHRIELLRILSVGKSKEEVIAYMGEPNNIEDSVKCNGSEDCIALEFYSSGLYDKTHKTGPDDIKIILDSENKIVSVYYTDHPWEASAYAEIVKK